MTITGPSTEKGLRGIVSLALKTEQVDIEIVDLPQNGKSVIKITLLFGSMKKKLYLCRVKV